MRIMSKYVLLLTVALFYWPSSALAELVEIKPGLSVEGEFLDMIKFVGTNENVETRAHVTNDSSSTMDWLLADTLNGGATVSNFTWPIDPYNTTAGHDGPCGDWKEKGKKLPDGCFWVSDNSEDAKITWRDAQPFQRHLNKKYDAYHLGADYNFGGGAADKGKLVYPAADGTIRAATLNVCGWGNVIFVEHSTDSEIITTMYGHVDWLPSGPPSGQVTTQTPIAVVGNGAWNCGKKNRGKYPYHLHLEVRKGDSIDVRRGYTDNQLGADVLGPQGQVDPNKFIIEN